MEYGSSVEISSGGVVRSFLRKTISLSAEQETDLKPSSGSNVASNCSQSQQNADSPLASAPAAPSASPPEQSSTVPIQQRTSSPDPTPPQLTCKEVFDISLRGLYILSKTYDPNSNLRMFTTAAQHILVAGTDCFSGPRALDVINLDTIHRGFRHDYLTAFASLLVAEGASQPYYTPYNK